MEINTFVKLQGVLSKVIKDIVDAYSLDEAEFIRFVTERFNTHMEDAKLDNTNK